MIAWIESSGLISADHPPLGLSPNKGAAAIRVMQKGGNPASRKDGMVSPGSRWRRHRIGWVALAKPNVAVNWRAGADCIRSRILADKAAIRHAMTDDDASAA
jgi:hypothetical protein